jgi:two-component system alkaline phosphatase synthesis response regulator PhoP
MNAEKPIDFYIIDDDPMMIMILTDLIEERGHSVTSNSSAEMSLSEIRTQKPDCILVDLQMPVMDGLELCEAIRKMPQLSKTKIIFVSSHNTDTWKLRATEAGGDGYVEKPIDDAVLFEIIETAMAAGPKTV